MASSAVARRFVAAAGLSAVLALAACSDPASSTPNKATAAAAPSSAMPPAPSPPESEAAPPGSPDAVQTPAAAPDSRPGEPAPEALSAAASAIDEATPEGSAAAVARPGAYNPGIVRAEVLLDRAGFSPGAIDGRPGSNLDRALAAFAAAHHLPGSGPTPALWTALTRADAGPAVRTYTVTAADLAGPFIGAPPKDYSALAKLPALGYASPAQELAERFHMAPALLAALNPGADFSRAGETITVAAPRGADRTLPVARIEVDKSQEQVRAFDAQGRLLATYPATVGSTERPAPSGAFAVVAVAPHPAYYYDPKRLTFTPKGATGKLKIAPGPNNPVGSTWIALTIPTYGIHGAPDPTLIGKRQSHGCVRLTNWDVVELGRSVKKGVRVDFVGRDAPARGRG